jgi:hypothetical protein
MSGGSSDLPSVSTMSSPGAVRMARHRSRRRNGLHCLTIELRESEIDALIRDERLAAASRTDIAAVKQALYGFLDDTLR